MANDEIQLHERGVVILRYSEGSAQPVECAGSFGVRQDDNAPHFIRHSSFAIRHSAFTLIEMLLATVLAGLLMGGVLVMASAIGRDRARVAADESKPRANHLVEQFRWDLTNAMTIAQLDNGRAMILVGHGGLDPVTLAPTGRLTRVIYEVRGKGRDAALFRRQDYLDDPVRPQAWTEVVSLGVVAFAVFAESGDFEPVAREKPTSIVPTEEEISPKQRRVPQAYFIPTRARLSIQKAATTMDEELWLR